MSFESVLVWEHCRPPVNLPVSWCLFFRFPPPVCAWRGLQHWTVCDGLPLAKRLPLGTRRDRCRSTMLGRWDVIPYYYDALVISVWDLPSVILLKTNDIGLYQIPDIQVLSSVFLQQICVPKADEWTRFVRTLAEINENRDEAEELANVWCYKPHTDNRPWIPLQYTTHLSHTTQHWLPAFPPTTTWIGLRRCAELEGIEKTVLDEF